MYARAYQSNNRQEVYEMRYTGDFRSWFGTIDLNTGMIMPISPIGGVALRVRDIAVVPEPASMLALSAGLTALAALRRRKR